jgi:dihydroneopterin aldolase
MAGASTNMGTNGLQQEDTLWLEIDNLDVDVLTGIYSEETHLPQPLRISIRALLKIADHYAPDTPLRHSKNYMDLKHAATRALPEGKHFTLIEAVAEHIIETIFLQDDKVLHVEVKIVKVLLTERQENIGITMGRWRK